MYNSDVFVVWWVHVHHLFVCIGWVLHQSFTCTWTNDNKVLTYILNPFHRIQCSCGSVVEHCVSSTKGCGFNSQETHILIIHV